MPIPVLRCSRAPCRLIYFAIFFKFSDSPPLPHIAHPPCCPRPSSLFPPPLALAPPPPPPSPPPPPPPTPPPPPPSPPSPPSPPLAPPAASRGRTQAGIRVAAQGMCAPTEFREEWRTCSSQIVNRPLPLGQDRPPRRRLGRREGAAQ